MFRRRTARTHVVQSTPVFPFSESIYRYYPGDMTWKERTVKLRADGVLVTVEGDKERQVNLKSYVNRTIVVGVNNYTRESNLFPLTMPAAGERETAVSLRSVHQLHCTSINLNMVTVKVLEKFMAVVEKIFPELVEQPLLKMYIEDWSSGLNREEERPRVVQVAPVRDVRIRSNCLPIVVGL